MSEPNKRLEIIQLAFYKLFQDKIKSAKPSDVRIKLLDGRIALQLAPSITGCFAGAGGEIDIEEMARRAGDNASWAEQYKTVNNMIDEMDGNKPSLVTYMRGALNIDLPATSVNDPENMDCLTMVFGPSITIDTLEKAALSYLEKRHLGPSP